MSLIGYEDRSVEPNFLPFGSDTMCNLLSDCGCWHKGSARYRQLARLSLAYEVDVHSRLTMVVRRSGAAIYWARAAGRGRSAITPISSSQDVVPPSRRIR